jgi:hypothetical protein
VTRLHIVDFLLVQDGLSRPPLKEWAKTIRHALEEELIRDEKNITCIVSLLNLAAWVEALRGDTSSARAVCEAELAWLSSLTFKGYQHATLSTLALQPWINIGRLCRIEGKVEEALQHFALVLRRTAHTPSILGPYSVTLEDWESFGLEVLSVLWNIYAVESLKSFFQFGQFKAALDFIVHLSAAKHSCLHALLREGEILSHAGLADYGRAYSVAKSRSTQEILDTAIFMYYEAFCLTRLDRRDEASQIVGELTSFITLGGLAQFSAPIVMRYLERFGGLLETLGREIEASWVYDRGYQVAVEAGDQPFQIAFLGAKIHQLGNERTLKERETRDTLLSDCHYYKILREEKLPDRRWTKAFGDLAATVSIATEGAFVLKSSKHTLFGRGTRVILRSRTSSEAIPKMSGK